MTERKTLSQPNCDAHYPDYNPHKSTDTYLRYLIVSTTFLQPNPSLLRPTYPHSSQPILQRLIRRPTTELSQIHTLIQAADNNHPAILVYL